MTNRLDITVADGKYRIVQQADGGTVALRYGEDWLDVTNTPGSNMILAMAQELEELRARRPLTEEQYLFISLMEECAEVIQRTSKGLRFGMKEVQPGQDEDNAQRLAGELTDLKTIAGMFETNGALPPSGDVLDVLAKHARVEHFMAYARGQGTLA